MDIWRLIQKDNFKNISHLLEYLELSNENKKKVLYDPRFVLNLPKRLASKMRKNTLDDPIFRQFVPLKEELKISSDYCSSPVQDEMFQKSKKLLKKYEGRALLLATSACAMHCRYCFRQNYNYDHQNKSFEHELALIKSDPSLFEIILSGGDPLSLSDQSLEELIHQIASIPHIKILRFHTRFLVGIPERITDTLLKVLSQTRLQVIFIIHVNHPLEIDSEVALSIKKLQKLGIPILNHSVLLKGVNDNIETLKDLSLALISLGILPYYLNQLDKVQSAAHFEVNEEDGFSLIKQLRTMVPGYAVPEYIQEIPGMSSKTPLQQSHAIHSF